jgi:hypothetical protein
MVHIIIVPAFAVHDCESYYRSFVVGVGHLHTVQFLKPDGYTQSGKHCIGDVHLQTVVDMCVQEYNQVAMSCVLVGHSIGAVIVGKMYAHLTTKPQAVILFNPVVRPHRLCLCRVLPLVGPLMYLLNLLPIALITHVYTHQEFGTMSDVVPAMKFKLWIDLRSLVSLDIGCFMDHTTVITSVHDPIGNGSELFGSNRPHITKFPGHASFRSAECMTLVLSILVSHMSDVSHSFSSLYKLD